MFVGFFRFGFSARFFFRFMELLFADRFFLKVFFMLDARAFSDEDRVFEVASLRLVKSSFGTVLRFSADLTFLVFELFDDRESAREIFDHREIRERFAIRRGIDFRLFLASARRYGRERATHDKNPPTQICV